LVEFTTSKKDIKKGISRIPLEMARLKSEDIEMSSSIQLKTEESKEDQEDYSHQMDERTQSYARNDVPTFEFSDNTPDIIQGSRRSNTLYSKVRDDLITLDDFQIKKVIGQGSFGKVFMVQHKTTNKTYAMKSIRKDVVIDSEQLENLRLEKQIMLCVEYPFLISMEYVFQRDYRIYFLMDFIR
jgi:hypothetical protein